MMDVVTKLKYMAPSVFFSGEPSPECTTKNLLANK
jgi:hypothetical protein